VETKRENHSVKWLLKEAKMAADERGSTPMENKWLIHVNQRSLAANDSTRRLAASERSLDGAGSAHRSRPPCRECHFYSGASYSHST
jgi:hypothetical protein